MAKKKKIEKEIKPSKSENVENTESLKGKDEKAILRIKDEIKKIDDKTNKIYFFVIDSKGNPSGSLEYIYNLALILKDDGYDVEMLYNEEEFKGVSEWLPEKYSGLKHTSISSGEVGVSPSDILFIPELFSNVMEQTKKLPCKRIMILQNYDYMVESLPYSAQLGGYGILDAITNTSLNKEYLENVFPYVKTTVIHPYINKMFDNDESLKDMVVNIVSRKPEDVNKITKPFYWKYPTYKWVTFRDLRGLSKKDFAESLRTAAVTIWVDEDTSFGYSAIEAMKSGSIVIAKIPNNKIEWTMSKENNSNLSNGCVWFDTYHSVHKILASVIRAWTTDSVPAELEANAKKVSDDYVQETTKREITEYVANIMKTRKNDMKIILNEIGKK